MPARICPPSRPTPASAETTRLSRRTFIAAAAATVLACPAYATTIGSPRVASLDYGLASTLLSLGLPPVAIADRAAWSKWVFSPAMPDDVVDLGGAMEVNLEILAAVKPDIILTTPYLDSVSGQLSSYGRLVRLSVYEPDSGSILDAATAATRRLGETIGRLGEADAFLDRSDAYFEACRRRIAAAAPPPMAFINLMDARHVRIYGEPGLFANVLARIGVANAWTEPSNYWGFQTIAIEELSRMAAGDAFLVALKPIPGDALPKLAESPLWQALPFARTGQFHIIEPALMFGMVNEAMRFAGLVTDLAERAA